MKGRSKATGDGEGCGDESVGNPLGYNQFFFLKNCRQHRRLQCTGPVLREEVFWPTYPNSIDVLDGRLWKLCFINLPALSQEPQETISARSFLPVIMEDKQTKKPQTAATKTQSREACGPILCGAGLRRVCLCISIPSHYPHLLSLFLLYNLSG